MCGSLNKRQNHACLVYLAGAREHDGTSQLAISIAAFGHVGAKCHVGACSELRIYCLEMLCSICNLRDVCGVCELAENQRLQHCMSIVRISVKCQNQLTTNKKIQRAIA